VIERPNILQCLICGCVFRFALNSEDQLATADRRIAEALPRIERQKLVLDNFTSNGWDTRLARKVLDAMTDAMRLMHRHRQILEQQILERQLPPRDWLHGSLSSKDEVPVRAVRLFE